ncbi:MAG: hypothetical protein HRU38_23400 [Saccharospirillaceae bacterium]|nr:hypothetical protein [Saccharospirillaceae bacterium]
METKLDAYLNAISNLRKCGISTTYTESLKSESEKLKSSYNAVLAINGVSDWGSCAMTPHKEVIGFIDNTGELPSDYASFNQWLWSKNIKPLSESDVNLINSLLPDVKRLAAHIRGQTEQQNKLRM